MATTREDGSWQSMINLVAGTGLLARRRLEPREYFVLDWIIRVKRSDLG